MVRHAIHVFIVYVVICQGVVHRLNIDSFKVAMDSPHPFVSVMRLMMVTKLGKDQKIQAICYWHAPPNLLSLPINVLEAHRMQPPRFTLRSSQ